MGARNPIDKQPQRKVERSVQEIKMVVNHHPQARENLTRNQRKEMDKETHSSRHQTVNRYIHIHNGNNARNKV